MKVAYRLPTELLLYLQLLNDLADELDLNAAPVAEYVGEGVWDVRLVARDGKTTYCGSCGCSLGEAASVVPRSSLLTPPLLLAAVCVRCGGGAIA